MQCYVNIYIRNIKDRNLGGHLNLLGNNSNFGPLVELNGCFYHLCLSTWRHAQELGLTALYMANDDAKKFVDMMDGLAFLPVQDIAAGVVIVRNFMPNLALAPLLTYILQTYVGVWVFNANNQMVFRLSLFPLPSSVLECLHYNPCFATFSLDTRPNPGFKGRGQNLKKGTF